MSNGHDLSLLIARAIVVPCRGHTTLLLSLPVPLLFLLIELVAPGIRSPDFVAHAAWDQAVLLLSAASWAHANGSTGTASPQ